MESKFFVTVIIPVYNAEMFLEQTLNSVLGSGEEDVELIAVDDESTDRSLEILREYEKKHPNMKVITQKNSGPAKARNNGLDHASGRFVYFLDSDDLLELSVLRSMCEKAEKTRADLVISSYDIFNEFRRFSVPSIQRLSQMEEIRWDSRLILWTFSLCNKLFRRSRIEEWGLRFPDTNYSEDGVFVMDYVYHSEKITGYDGIVFHYRRLTVSENKSITSSVTVSKVQDYLRSHDMIYDLMSERMKQAFGPEMDFELLKEESRAVNGYANEFLKKEISILFNQFYKFFWSLEEELIQIIVENIGRLLKKVDLKTYYELADKIPEVPLKNMPRSYAQARREARIAVVLYGKPEEKDRFLRALESLTLQRFIPYKILVPEGMKDFVEESIELKHQIEYVPGEERTSFYGSAVRSLETDYVMFADPGFVYEKSTLTDLYSLVRNTHTDFITASVYIANEEQSFPAAFHGRALLYAKNIRNGKRVGKTDSILGNKLISLEFLKLACGEELRSSKICPKLYRNGYFAVTEKCYVVYAEGDEESLRSYMGKESEELKKDEINALDLKDSRFDTNPLEVYRKLRLSDIKKNAWKRKLIYTLAKLPIQNRVLFFSVRRDGELDDNLKCVEEKVRGNKKIVSMRLPHDEIYKMKMYYYVATSRVIVTDDYVRYLRLFPLKREQRVVQLWHACGAFKKFGLHGTNLSVGLERSTHVQYNLVCVSSEDLRPIYASAFDVDTDRVAALGVPRTDLFFQTEAIEQKTSAIYEKHPEWKEKEIILYAPTFRDKSGDRTKFRPQIDFNRLSEKLLPNQIFLIAPHPVMKDAILEEDYDNIFEVRDIHTLDLMFVSDQLVTDYSSVIFEYSLLRKPIVFFCYDLEVYDRGFYLSYDENLPGTIVKTEDALVQAITGEDRFELKPSYDTFVEKYMGACDGKASDRIAGLIQDYLGRTL